LNIYIPTKGKQLKLLKAVIFTDIPFWINNRIGTMHNIEFPINTIIELHSVGIKTMTYKRKGTSVFYKRNALSFKIKSCSEEDYINKIITLDIADLNGIEIEVMN